VRLSTRTHGRESRTFVGEANPANDPLTPINWKADVPCEPPFGRRQPVTESATVSQVQQSGVMRRVSLTVS